MAILSASNIHTEKDLPCLQTYLIDNTALYYNYFTKKTATLEQSIESLVHNFLEDIQDGIINYELDYYYNKFATSKYIGCGAAEFIGIPPIDDPAYDPATYEREGLYGVHCVFEARTKQNWLQQLPEGEPCSACEDNEICDKEYFNLCTDR